MGSHGHFRRSRTAAQVFLDLQHHIRHENRGSGAKPDYRFHFAIPISHMITRTSRKIIEASAKTASHRRAVLLSFSIRDKCEGDRCRQKTTTRPAGWFRS